MDIQQVTFFFIICESVQSMFVDKNLNNTQLWRVLSLLYMLYVQCLETKTIIIKQDIINTDDEGVRHAERICIFVMCILNIVYPLQYVLEQKFRVRFVGGNITYVVRSIWSFPLENNIIIPKKTERVNLNARLLFVKTYIYDIIKQYNMDGNIVALMSYTHYTDITCIIGTKERTCCGTIIPAGNIV